MATPLRAVRSDVPARPPGTVRVVTYNVHSCIGNDRRVDVGRVVEVLRALDADFIGLQEVDVGRERTDRVDQPSVIAEALDMSVRFARAVRWPDGEYGIAALSRLPIVGVEGLPLPVPRLPFIHRRVAQRLVLRFEDRDMAVYNTHLGLLRSERREQVDALARWMANVDPATPTLLTGDLNASPAAVELRPLDPHLSDAFGDLVHGHTFPVRLPFSRIDQIRVNSHFECVSLAIPRTALTRMASDHFPIVADLRFK